MRRIERVNLAPETANPLQLLQEEVDRLRKQENFDPGQHWAGRRQSQTVLAVLLVLKRMSGSRQRCMYCVDSEATDIEHFWPKDGHPNRMYAWDNLLLACAQCGRYKGTQFPLSADGSPLVVDPSAEDPWEFLDFNPETGNLSARFLPDAGVYSAKGETTVTVLHLDRREGVAVGFRKTYHRLCDLVAAWSDQVIAPDYVERLREADDHGLLGWFFRGAGKSELVFERFRGRYPDEWAACEGSIR